MHYRYVDPNGKPVQSCPECGTRWDMNHGISINILVGDSLSDHDTMLDQEGDLVDVDNLVANGYHAGTYCGGCGELLVNMEGVIEESFDFSDDEERELWDSALMDDLEDD